MADNPTKKMYVQPLVQISKRYTQATDYNGTHYDGFTHYALIPTRGSADMKPLMTALTEEELEPIADAINDEHVTRMRSQLEKGATEGIKELTAEIVGRVTGGDEK